MDFTEEDINRLREKYGRPTGGTELAVAGETEKFFPEPIDRPLRYINRAARTLGLGIGTVVGGGLNTMLDPYDKTPIGRWLPDVELGDIARGGKAFWEQARQGDWDAGIEAYQDELDAGKGFWTVAELAGSLIPTGGPAIAGAKILSNLPKLASTISKVAPVAQRAKVAEKYVEPALKLGAKGLQLPWKAETLLGQGMLFAAKETTKFAAKVTGLSWLGGKAIALSRPAAMRFAEAVRRHGGRQVDPEDAARVVDTEVDDTVTFSTISADGVVNIFKVPNTASNRKSFQETMWGLKGNDIAIQEGVLNTAQLRKLWVDTFQAARTGGHDVVQARAQQVFTRIERLKSELDALVKPHSKASPKIKTAYQKKKSALEKELKSAQRTEGKLPEQTYELDPWIREQMGEIQDPFDLAKVFPQAKKFSPEEVASNLAGKADPEKAVADISADAIIGKTTMKQGAKTKLENMNLDVREHFNVDPQLGWWSNKVNSWFNMGRTTAVEGVLETAQRARKTIMYQAESAGASLSKFLRPMLRDPARKVFTSDPKTGYITDEALQGNNTNVRVWYDGGEAILQSPTLQDIAARLPTYLSYLTKPQREFMKQLKAIMEEGMEQEVEGAIARAPGWAKILRETSPDWNPKRIRPDIEDGGFYLPRGDSTGPGLKKFTIHEEIARSMDPMGGKPLGAEKIAEMPAMGKLVRPDGTVLARNTYGQFEKTMAEFIEDVAERITGLNLEVKATELAKRFPGTRPIEGLPKLSNLTADDPVAKAIEKNLKDGWAKKLMGTKAGLKWRAFDQLYKATKSTWDFSALGIHGARAMIAKPELFGNAASVMFRALARGGQPVADDSIRVFDQEMIQAKRLTSQIWVFLGLRQGGSATEVAFPAINRLLDADLPLAQLAPWLSKGLGKSLELSNIIFGAFGDTLRLRWADDLLQEQLMKGKTIKQLFDSGELRQMANAANRHTGWSDTMFGGDIGGAVMFTARFFQARVEEVAQGFLAVTQVRPPTLGALSRESLKKTRLNVPLPRVERGGALGVPVPKWVPRFGGAKIRPTGKPLIESDVLTSTGRGQSIESREALRTLIRVLGWGGAATEAMNGMLGQETDRRPIVNGRVNPAFYTVEIEGRKFSLFGPMVGLFRAVVTLLSDPTPRGFENASRGLMGGAVQVIWDNITGYTVMGEKAPVGILRGARGEGETDLASDEGYFSSPAEMAEYLAKLAGPISPTQVGPELVATGKAIKEGDIPGMVVGTIAALWESGGGRVTAQTRTEAKDEIALRLFNKRFADLYDARVKFDIETMATEKLGEKSYTGKKAWLQRKRDASKNTLLEGINALTEAYLNVPVESADYSPEAARGIKAEGYMPGYKTLIEAYRDENYGKWDTKAQRFVGGINEQIYGVSEPQEEPEQGTPEHLLWKYHSIFDEARGEDGAMDWEEVSRLSGRFWHSLKDKPEDMKLVLSAIRKTEKEYPEAFQKMLQAGRYVQSVKILVGTPSDRNKPMAYWDLDRHPDYINWVAGEVGVSPQTVQAYMDLPWQLQKSARNVEGHARLIQDAMNAAGRLGGIYDDLKKEFVGVVADEDSPQYTPQWIIGMLEAGYSYIRSEEINTNLREQIRNEGLTLPALDYVELWTQQILKQ